MNVTQNEPERRELLFPKRDTPESATTRLATTLHAAGDGVVVTDLQGRVEFLNLAAERLLAMKSRDAEGQLLNQVLRLEESDGRPIKGDLVELAIVSEAPVALGKDLQLRPRSGPCVQVEGEICIRSGGGAVTGSVVTFRDVTVRNLDELQKREEQKMLAVAQMAGAVAHALNNHLTVIVGNREVIDELYPDQKAVHNSTSEIQRAADQIATVTRQLLTLSRREVLSPKRTDLNKLLRDLAPELESLIPDNVYLAMSLEPRLGTVVVDSEQLAQAILELICYCRERTPMGGRIELTTANVIVDRNYRARHHSRFVELTVADTGLNLKGVPVERLFEPTWTKEPGRPAGLSLFTVRNVVNAANGHLSAITDDDSGTRFVIRLPEWKPDPLASDTGDEPACPSILLVEDDDAIRILLRNSLEKQGYHVIEARDGAEAIFQADLHDERIDLLITDVVMPVMGGPMLARELLEKRPGIRLLMISGCPDDLLDVKQLIDRGAQFVQKPFSQRQLLARVDEILRDRTE
jgi:hypothetical protein